MWLNLFSHTLYLSSTFFSHITSHSDLTQSHSSLDPTHNSSPLPKKESSLLSTLSTKCPGGWNITINAIYIRRIPYLFSKGWYFKYHTIHSCSLKPFHLPPTTYHQKRVGRNWVGRTPGYLLEEKHTNKGNTNSEKEEKVKEGVEVTVTQPQTYLEIQLNSVEITQHKLLNRSKIKSSKPCKHGRITLNTTCPHLYIRIQQVLDRVTLSQPAGGKDPPKKDPTTIKT